MSTDMEHEIHYFDFDDMPEAAANAIAIATYGYDAHHQAIINCGEPMPSGMFVDLFDWAKKFIPGDCHMVSIGPDFAPGKVTQAFWTFEREKDRLMFGKYIQTGALMRLAKAHGVPIDDGED